MRGLQGKARQFKKSKNIKVGARQFKAMQVKGVVGGASERHMNVGKAMQTGGRQAKPSQRRSK